MSTKLAINILESTFVSISNTLQRQNSVYQNYYYYFITLVTCNNYFCEFLKVQWLHFTRVVD